MARLRRTISIKGGGIGLQSDSGRYYSCWNCGAICDSQREVTGGTSGQLAKQYVELSDPYQAFAPNDPDKINHVKFICCDTLGVHHETLCELDAASSPKKPYGGWKAEVVHGCWFCGCPTWKG